MCYWGAIHRAHQPHGAHKELEEAQAYRSKIVYRCVNRAQQSAQTKTMYLFLVYLEDLVYLDETCFPKHLPAESPRRKKLQS